MTDDSSAYHEILQKILETQSKIKDLTEARQADGDEQRVNNDNDPKLMGEAKNAMHDMFDMMANQSSNPLSPEERGHVKGTCTEAVLFKYRSHSALVLAHMECNHF